MSRKPGIARKWIEKYKEDVYRFDHVIIKGRKLKPAKYYDKIYDITNPDEFLKIKNKRKEEALKRKEDNTPQRLKEKNKFTQEVCKKLIRTYEQ